MPNIYERGPTIDKSSVSGKKILICGLGRFGGGAGVARWLAAQNANVLVTDLAPAERLREGLDELKDCKIDFRLGEHREEDFRQADLIVVNPAVPDDSPYLAAARQVGVGLTTEINLFFERCRAPIVGVTGSNGKSTTTAMTGLALAGTRTTWVGGNIGKSLLEDLDRIEPEDAVVLELSSFQLERLRWIRRSPHIAVVTNLSPNHLDRHGTYEAYLSAKRAILDYQTESDVAVFWTDDPTLRQWSADVRGRYLFYSDKDADGLSLKVPGQHNRVNAAAAVAAAECLGVKRTDALSRLATFTGLEHRLEWVAEKNGVRYYNDSIATTPESVAVALDAFDEPKIVICGGYDKKISLDGMAERLARQAHTVIGLGQVRDTLLGLIERYRGEGDCPRIFPVETLPETVEQARRIARPGDVVLLSPGCASYDMFTNFIERGRRFRECVGQLDD